MLPWLWCRPAAVAPIGPLAWELPYAAGTALKDKKTKNKQTKKLFDFLNNKGILPVKEGLDISSVPRVLCVELLTLLMLDFKPEHRAHESPGKR